MDAEYFNVSPNWARATRGLPPEAESLLRDLVGQAARERSLTLSVDVPFLELLRSEPRDQPHVHHWFELLLNRGFVREVDYPSSRHSPRFGFFFLAETEISNAAASDSLANLAPDRQRPRIRCLRRAHYGQ